MHTDLPAGWRFFVVRRPSAGFLLFSGRLTSAGGQTYSYDSAGNRNSAQYQIDAANQYDTDGNWNYIYDAAGNVAEKDGIGANAGFVWKYGYDGYERLISATETSSGTQIDQVNVSYDVFGNRVEEDVTKNGTTTVTKMAYDANGVCYADISGTGSIVTRRVNLDAVDALFARIGQTGTIAWYLTDHLGSVRGLMNNAGSLIDALSYDAYGNVTSETSPSNGDRYAFTGRERDVETGLQYNRARWYDPATGRWITQDPLGFDAGDSNLYRYVMNGPTNSADSSGMGPNQQHVVNLPGLIKKVALFEQQKENVGKTPAVVLDRLQSAWRNTTDKWYYLYTKRYDWVDINHFLTAASYQTKLQGAVFWGLLETNLQKIGTTTGIVEYAGLIQELRQLFVQRLNYKHPNRIGEFLSAFTFEDMVSNSAGVDFAAMYSKELQNKNNKLSTLLVQFFRDQSVGAWEGPPGNSPGFAQLPKTEKDWIARNKLNFHPYSRGAIFGIISVISGTWNAMRIWHKIAYNVGYPWPWYSGK
jgi:RHS repeat-associated protein